MLEDDLDSEREIDIEEDPDFSLHSLDSDEPEERSDNNALDNEEPADNSDAEPMILFLKTLLETPITLTVIWIQCSTEVLQCVLPPRKSAV